MALVQQMPNVEITLEANHHTLDDLADLAQFGRRIEYFKVTATRGDDDRKPREVLRLQLGVCDDFDTMVKNLRLRLDRDRLHATDPDLETKAVIYEIESFIGRHRRHGAAMTTILNTGTRAEAPTWWHEYSSHVGIGVVTAAVFYLLGLLTAHL